jgi:PAS domain S-box-containing protein
MKKTVDKKSLAAKSGPKKPFLAVSVITSAAAVIIAAAVIGQAHPILIGIVVAAAMAAIHGLISKGITDTPAVNEISRAKLFQIVPCYISVQDRDFRIVKTNNLFKRHIGNFIGRYCYMVYKGRDSICPDCPVEKTFHDGVSYSREETIETRDGVMAQMIVHSSPLRDKRGRITHVMEMMTDITEVKQLQNELEESRKQYKEFFDKVPCTISIQDRNFRIVGSNTLFKRNFGECAGRTCHTIYKGRDNVCPNCPVARSLEDGRSHSSEEILITRDGQPAHMIVHSMPLRNEEGEIDRVMEMMTDITEVKLLQRELTTTGRAVAGMAHRIKNILMGLEGGIFVANTGMETDDKKTVALGWEMVERNVGKVTHIVKDMLYCSKTRTPSFKTISPAAIAEEVHTLFHKRSADAGIDFVLDLADVPESGSFDPDSLHSLMTNLVTNAIDACLFDMTEGKDGHRITLRCSRDDGGNMLVEVADTGPGIPLEAQDKIFEDFFSTKGSEGTGLGLLVAQKVAEEHGGSISFETEEGRGTTFRARLPVDRRLTEKQPPPPP